MMHYLLRSFFLLLLVSMSGQELQVRVSPFQNMGTEEASNDRTRLEEELAIYDLSVSGNTSTDTVQIEFKWADGSPVSVLTDFRMQTQIIRVMLLGEVELGLPPVQPYCFVSSFTGDVIPPEAVMKLRQKNPTTIRVADEDRGEVVQDSYLLIKSNVLKTASISSHLATFCKDARDAIYSSEHELFSILGHNGDTKVSEISQIALKDAEFMPRCYSVQDLRHPCICSLQTCLDWYPCALKYCKDREGEGEHRCGIRTCKKCFTYRFPVRERALCLWDEV